MARGRGRPSALDKIDNRIEQVGNHAGHGEGQSTGESMRSTWPNPQTSATTSATSTATARPVRASQITRACRSLGGGKSMFISTLPQLPGFLRRRADRADERAAQFALLQFVEALDGCAARAGDHVFEHAGMQAGFQHHLRAAQHSLGRQPSCDLARQTGSDAAIAKPSMNR